MAGLGFLGLPAGECTSDDELVVADVAAALFGDPFKSGPPGVMPAADLGTVLANAFFAGLCLTDRFARAIACRGWAGFTEGFGFSRALFVSGERTSFLGGAEGRVGTT